MSTPAYVLNFDAELELADSGYTRSSRMQAHCDRLAREFRDELRAARLPGVVIDPEIDQVPEDPEVVCWCPTPRALDRVRELGLRVPEAPGPTVLRRVNHRGFAAELERSLDAEWRLDHSVFHQDPESALADLATRSMDVVMKRALGFAGRGQKRVTPHAIDDAVRAWVRGSFDDDAAGLVIEPLAEIVDEWSVQGFAVAEGARLRRILGFRSDDDGAYLSAVVGGQLDEDSISALGQVFRTVGRALIDAGYRGPVAFDAFRYRAGGQTRLRALSDLNARLTRTTFARG